VGAYIARENIAVGEALAYTRGQRVEADAVKANGWEDQVVGEGSKEARGHPGRHHRPARRGRHQDQRAGQGHRATREG
jgi:hypothetical protein